ncbi:MAG TPA: glycosyltransferase [Candidatus Peribacteraceae bacterium]|nr:glycosyltransferase [Candidatus Peribacteraceae bacterium]
MPALSVIIPTHKRAPILRRCLEHLEQQTIAEMIEVIVVSDGPDEQTTQMLKERSWKIPVHFFTIEKSQQGKARNRGVQEAQSPLVLFIGDDIFLEPMACEEHLRAHRISETAVLGFITWDPALPQTKAMRWLEASGWQFGYKMIGGFAHDFLPTDMQPRFSYTSNISVPIDIAKSLPFREDVTLYGWEDIEWGMRLRDNGIRLLYSPSAKGWHHHAVTMQESFERMRTLGRSAAIMEKIVPGFGRVPDGFKRLAYRFSSLLPTMAGKHRKAFLEGIAQARVM